VSLTDTVCVRNAAPIVDSCAAAGREERVTCTLQKAKRPASAARLEVEELSLHEAQHEAGLASAHVAQQHLRQARRQAATARNTSALRSISCCAQPAGRAPAQRGACGVRPARRRRRAHTARRATRCAQHTRARTLARNARALQPAPDAPRTRRPRPHQLSLRRRRGSSRHGAARAPRPQAKTGHTRVHPSAGSPRRARAPRPTSSRASLDHACRRSEPSSCDDARSSSGPRRSLFLLLELREPRACQKGI
jgi:hypothetical protein